MPWFRWPMGIRLSLVSLAGSDSGKLGTKWVVKTSILALYSLPTEDPNVSMPCGVWLWDSSGAGVARGCDREVSKERSEAEGPCRVWCLRGQWNSGLEFMSGQNWSTLQSGVSSPCSHEPLEWAEAPREADPYHTVQAPDSAAAPWEPGGPRPDQGLWHFSSTSFQETRLQKFPKHLSPFCHSSSVQYSVSIHRESSCLAVYWSVCSLGVRAAPCCCQESSPSSLFQLSCHAKRLLVGNLEKCLMRISFLRLSWSINIFLTGKIFCFRPSVTEEDLKLLFSSNGGVVKGFKFFQ